VFNFTDVQAYKTGIMTVAGMGVTKWYQLVIFTAWYWHRVQQSADVSRQHEASGWWLFFWWM